MGVELTERSRMKGREPATTADCLALTVTEAGRGPAGERRLGRVIGRRGRCVPPLARLLLPTLPSSRPRASALARPLRAGPCDKVPIEPLWRRARSRVQFPRARTGASLPSSRLQAETQSPTPQGS